MKNMKQAAAIVGCGLLAISQSSALAGSYQSMGTASMTVKSVPPVVIEVTGHNFNSPVNKEVAASKAFTVKNNGLGPIKFYYDSDHAIAHSSVGTVVSMKHAGGQSSLNVKVVPADASKWTKDASTTQSYIELGPGATAELNAASLTSADKPTEAGKYTGKIDYGYWAD